MTFVPAVSGHPAVLRADAHLPQYRVRPGATLTIRVTVTVPGHVRLTSLWFGISTGTWGNAANGRPVGMHPILARVHRTLSAGPHTFDLRWHIPQHQPASSVYLIYAWASAQPPASVAGPIARFTPT